MESKSFLFFQNSIPAGTRTRIRKALSVLLYGWTTGCVVFPLSMLRRAGVLPVGRRRFFGTSLIRYYWARFLAAHVPDFQGDAAEIDSTETIRDGGRRNRLQGGPGLRTARAIDIASSGREDIVADLSDCWQIPEGRFDLLVVPFTYHMILKDREALFHSIRLLRPGGVLLCNFPAICGYFPDGLPYKGYTGYVYRCYTPRLVEVMLAGTGLSRDDYTLTVNGNWLSRILYAGCYVPSEVVPRFLLKDHPEYPVLISVRVRKPAGWNTDASF